MNPAIKNGRLTINLPFLVFIGLKSGYFSLSEELTETEIAVQSLSR